MTLNELITSLTEQTKTLKHELKQNGDRTLDFDSTTKAVVLPFDYKPLLGDGKKTLSGIIEINTQNELPNLGGLLSQAIILPIDTKAIECPHCHNIININIK